MTVHRNRLGSIAVPGAVEEVVEQGEPTATPQVEAVSIGSDEVSDNPWVVETPCDDLSGHLGDSGRFDVISEKVVNHPSGSRGGDAAENDALRTGDTTAVEANIGPGGLASSGKGELLNVCPKVTHPVERRGGRMGHHGDVRVVQARPRRSGGVEPEPRSSEGQMVDFTGGADAIHALGDAFEEPFGTEVIKSASAETGLPSLPSGNEAPLALRNVGQPPHRRWHTANVAAY